MGRKSTGRKSYDTAFKFATIEEYFSGDLSFSDFCKKKSLDRTTFRFWLLTFAPEGYLNSSDMSKQKERSDSDEIRELKRQLRQKELELKKEKMRAFMKRWWMLLKNSSIFPSEKKLAPNGKTAYCTNRWTFCCWSVQTVWCE